MKRTNWSKKSIKHFKDLFVGFDTYPNRDWFLMLSLFSVLFIIVIVVNVYFFFYFGFEELKEGDEITSQEARDFTLNEERLEEVLKFFEEKEESFETFSESSFMDIPEEEIPDPN